MRLERSTWPQVQEYFAHNDTVLMVFGSIEQHGRHNPLGCDLFSPAKIAELIEAQYPELLLAPAMPYGSSPRFVDFPGTFNLDDELLYQVALRLCESLYRAGARHFVMLNGHGGNTKSLTNVQLTMARRGCRCALLDWWKMCGDFNPAWAGGHGGGQETAAMLYVDPALVDTAAIADMGLVDDLGSDLKSVHFDTVEFDGVKVQVTRPTECYAPNGWIGPDHPKDATAQWGEEMLNAVADWATRFIKVFSATELPPAMD